MILNVMLIYFFIRMGENPLLIAAGLGAAGAGFFALAIALVWGATGKLGYPSRRAASRYFMIWTVVAAAFNVVVVSLLAYVLIQFGFVVAFWVATLSLAICVGSSGWNWIDGRRSSRFSVGAGEPGSALTMPE